MQQKTGRDRGDYRDQVITECVKAINRRYMAFTTQLHRDSSGTGLSTAILASGSAAIQTFAKADIARRLAAGSTFILGTGAAIDKNVFFDRTLPALEASMDAKRDLVLKQIIQSQRADPEGKIYTLPSAGYDLDAYQSAGNLYVAAAELTKTAVKAANEAADERDWAQNEPMGLGVYTPAAPGIAARFQIFYDRVRALQSPADDAALAALLQALQIVPPTEATFVKKQEVLVGYIKRMELAKTPAEQSANAAKLEEVFR